MFKENGKVKAFKTLLVSLIFVTMTVLPAGCANALTKVTKYDASGNKTEECVFQYGNVWKDLTEAEADVCGGHGSVKQSTPNAQAMAQMLQMFNMFKGMVGVPSLPTGQ